MLDEVKVCVSARVDFFEKYYDIPPNVQNEVLTLIEEIQTLGEGCADAGEFESKFVTSGLSEKFNTVLLKCVPKAMPITQEQKEYSKQVHQQMREEQKEEVAKDIFNYAADSVTMRVESDVMQANRRAMSEAGVLDDYTRASNMIDNAEYAANFLTKIFKRKKK